MDQPVIETERLLLRPFRKDDAGDVRKLAGNRNVSETTLNIPYPYRKGMAEEWISDHLKNWEGGTQVVYAVTEKTSKKLLGTVSLVGINDMEAELGYWMGEPYWGKGYCTEAAKSLVEFALARMGITKLTAEHLSSNPASGRVLEKLGMRHIESTQKPDRSGQLALMEIYASENR